MYKEKIIRNVYHYRDAQFVLANPLQSRGESFKNFTGCAATNLWFVVIKRLTWGRPNRGVVGTLQAETCAKAFYKKWFCILLIAIQPVSQSLHVDRSHYIFHLLHRVDTISRWYHRWGWCLQSWVFAFTVRTQWPCNYRKGACHHIGGSCVQICRLPCKGPHG